MKCAKQYDDLKETSEESKETAITKRTKTDELKEVLSKYFYVIFDFLVHILKESFVSRKSFGFKLSLYEAGYFKRDPKFLKSHLFIRLRKGP